ncbi:MAG TPA: S-layer homology domain-containing protein [Epulopiscium sp.]|nr:S-layer homology domain-containing protein [Candidatus Epulonipiscium sp.]
MNINKKVKRITSMVLVLLIACSNLVFGKGIDYEGHWAGYSINRLIDKGYVKGYEDGSLKPDNEITRAELISLVNRSFGFIAEVDITYTDIQESHWAYSEFKKAGAAGYISGFEDGTLRPNNKVTRQELAVIIARLLELEDNPTSDRLLHLYDASQIPAWSKGAVGAMVEKVYMHMRDGNIFGPTLPATRGETMFTLDSALSSLISVVDVTYSEMPTDDEN